MADETERRTALRAAITARDAAREVMQQRHAAHERGLNHVNKLRRQVADFITLDATIDAHITEALRIDGHAELPEELRGQLAARDVAQTTLASAERVASTLLHELSAATEAHKQAERAVTGALRAVTQIERDRLREKGRRLKRKGEAVEQLAGWADEADTWRPICDALLADPESASITITDLPDEPITAPPRPEFVIVPSVDEMFDQATGETVSTAEFHRRRRAEILAQAGPGVTEAMAIEQAIMRGRKLAG